MSHELCGLPGYSTIEEAEEAVVMLPEGTSAPWFSWLPFRHGLTVFLFLY